MSSTIDVNVLLYAADESSPFNAQAAELVRRLAQGPELLYLFWPVLIGYLRMSTHSAIFDRPLSNEVATQNVADLLDLPHARAVGESDAFWQSYGAATSGMVVTGNLVGDAHLVALILENGV
jgi:toxin-antitoxin system PIN domain toxin